MTINHLPLPKLQRFTYESFGYLTSAEGFVLLSGLTAGWVYSNGEGLQWKRMLKRAGVILACHLMLNNVLALAHWQIDGSVPTLLALLGQPESGYPSILLLYFVLMVMLPILILGFKKGLDKWVLATSAALWILAQWRIGPKLGIGYLLGWQLLFVAGAWLGFRRQQSRPFPGVGSRKVVIGVGICFAIFFLLRHPVVRHPILDLGWRITSKEGVGVVRVLDAALFAFLVAVIPLNVAQQLASRLALRPISFFGRHALQVYLWHQILVFSVGLYATRLVQGGLGLQLPVGVLAIASLMLPAWLHASYRDSRPRAALVPSQGRDRLELAKSAVRSEYAD